ncbi:hypothetical protein PIROE2DRAFT_3818 [Piromyces sp. E2]|nr:hypothetical protein PIROE2DRAFT_3818 [Piromyces sp. E2]|eukprot:OUM68518.1 hypothetical protein PIROE2DRAFT_3818 [Piromyces sp. E2]
MAAQEKYILYVCFAFVIMSSLIGIFQYIAIYNIIEILFKNYIVKDKNKENMKNVNVNTVSYWANHIHYNIKILIAEHIGFLPLGYFSKNTTGSISKTLEQNVDKIKQFFGTSLPDIVRTFVTIILAIIIFLHYNITLTIYYDVTEKISSSLTQFIYGLPEIKIYGKSIYSFKKLSDDLNKFRDISLECCYAYRSNYCLFIALLEAYAVFIVPFGGLLLLNHGSDISLVLEYIFFIVIGPSLSNPLFNLIQITKTFEEFEEGNNRLDAILNEDIIPPPLCPRVPKQYNVTFRNVYFDYKEKEINNHLNNKNDQKPVLNNISFEAENGKITALVGPSGSGKSTIGSLIPRFWDIEKGEICIGGINIKDITYPNLMNIISFVFQDTFLFNDTIYNNIAIGKPNTTKEEVIAAAKAAQCHEFIENLPKKYDTIFGSAEDEEGVRLSGGEKQRICIARAILKNSPILVLDEATAFSDPENEYNIQLALKELIKDKTVIVIAHNLNTIKSADNIIVVKEGKIVEQGKHDHLLSLNGLYNSMWNAYINSSKWFISNKQFFEYSNYSRNNYIFNEYNPMRYNSNPMRYNSNSMRYKAIDIKDNYSLRDQRKKISKKEGMISDNINLIYNITFGRPKRIYSAIFYTTVSNIINLGPALLTTVVIKASVAGRMELVEHI